MDKVRWGIIGPGKIANRFADGLKETQNGELVSIASLNEKRRNSFGDKYNIQNSLRFDNYYEILKSSKIDAIYISLPHNLHSFWSKEAAINSKHVLCEKPFCVNLNQALQTLSFFNDKIFFMEGFMYRCHPQIKKLINIIESKIIGEIYLIQSSFGFKAPFDPKSRLFNVNLSGGSILDVGLYPVSFSRFVATISNKMMSEPEKIEAKGVIGNTGVDIESSAKLYFNNNIIAEVETSIVKDLKNTAKITGTKGTIFLDIPWQPGKEGGPYDCSINIESETKNEVINMKGPEHLFFFEADHSNKCIIEGKNTASYPAMTINDTIGNLSVLDKWRKEIGYKLPEDDIVNFF